VTRIVGGTAKGRRLAVPSRGTRPTSERAREALFNSLQSWLDLPGAAVLDLFAGSGAIGLEALSRGAELAWFVESDRAAAEVVRRNIAAVGLAGAQLHRAPAAAFLTGRRPDRSFELAFLDPPYAFADDQLAALLVTLADGWLAEQAVIVVERAARGVAPRWPDSVTPLHERRYGEGMLWYGRAR
jgi:16S rRNA (guanine966-N2)-methyltransferase